MSISINSNLNNYDYQKYLSETQGKASDQQSTYKELLNDFLKLSNEGMQEYAGGQPTQFLPTGNYTPPTSTSDLTTDQKKQVLTKLQTHLNSTNSTSTSTVSEKLAAARSAVKEDLANFDPSTASDDQVNSLFKQVSETFASADPRRITNSLNSQNLGFPLSIAMNNLDKTSSTSSPLTVDDMKTLLANLVDTLSSDNANNTASSSNTLDSTLLDPLSGLDNFSANGDQIQSLFSQLTDALTNPQTQGQDNTSLQQNSVDTGLPPILQVSGAALPPFNWKPTSTL